MAKIILTIEEAQHLIATKVDCFPQFDMNPEVTIEVPKEYSNLPAFPEFKEFVTKWQYSAIPSRKIEMIKDLRDFYVKKGYFIMGLAEAKWFIEKMFFNVNYPG